MTELGSEGSVDPDAVRRLLDCDDYRKFIDSHSDCASSQVSSARGQARSPLKRNRRKVRRSPGADGREDGEGDGWRGGICWQACELWLVRNHKLLYVVRWICVEMKRFETQVFC